MARLKGISILGSTGSIGRSTLDVVRMHPDRFRVIALSAGENTALLKKQAEEFRPKFVSVLTKAAAYELKGALPRGTKAAWGMEGAIEAAAYQGADITVSAFAGAAGLVPTIEAVRAGKDIALANKETLVMAGALVVKEVKKHGVRLMPVDSEHCAIFQALCGHRAQDVKRIILTASGGPFLNTPYRALSSVTPKQALNHPRWRMGKKITIDCATLVNKGLEVIEARWLFDMTGERISVAVHPQSIVHSMVEYIDGSLVAQMGSPDMKGPIAYALSYPERIDSGTVPLQLAGLRLDFSDPDPLRFPCLGLAYEALKTGGVVPAALNAADEVAVEMFLKGRIRFTDIYRVIADVVGKTKPGRAASIEEILDADSTARDLARKAISGIPVRL